RWIGLGIYRREPNTVSIELRKGLDYRRRPISVGQHVSDVMHRNARTFEDGRSAKQVGNTGYHPASLAQLAESLPNCPGRGPRVHHDHVRPNHGFRGYRMAVATTARRPSSASTSAVSWASLRATRAFGASRLA